MSDTVKKRLTIGILAHVDAGKTTLSEALLYTAGSIRKAGRVDHGDAFLDTDEQEKRRGITIFSKQAVFSYGDTEFMLLDTPGHVDFSAETERTLQVLDAAVLVISAPDGVQSHTLTLWNLLKSYRIPVFLYINKMDQPGTKKDRVLEQLRNALKASFLDFTVPLSSPAMQEELASLDEDLMERYLEEDAPVEDGDICRLIRERKLFPCWFGSALKLQGVDTFLAGLDRYASVPEYPTEFGARVFKITRDEQGNRLTWMKVTGGKLTVKMDLPGTEEKADQLRLYSGSKFTPLREAPAGTVLAVTGPVSTRAGQGLGFEEAGHMPLLSPVLSYRILLPDGVDAAAVLPNFRSLEEEEPELKILWDERLKELHVQLMGEVQTEVLKTLVEKRFGLTIGFDNGSISYRETIKNTVEGVGHFEPLRHYAEVHLLLEPGEPGSGLTFETACRTDDLSMNWQRLILTHLEEKEYIGVLTGAPVTDLKITVVAGKSHLKHTEGGDFRQATYRAVRQGLMEAECVLLEPWYSFALQVPAENAGRAMTDLDRMSAAFALGDNTAYGSSGTNGDSADSAGSDTSGSSGSSGSFGSFGSSGFSGLAVPDGFTALSGRVPVSEIVNYADTVRAYTKGRGKLFLRFLGYFPCHNADAVIEAAHYDPELDLNNPADSVFCSHGVGTVIPWYEVKQYMHVPSVLSPASEDGDGAVIDLSGQAAARRRGSGEAPAMLSVEEIDAIIDRTFYANSKKKSAQRDAAARRRRYEAAAAVRSAAVSEKSAEAIRQGGVTGPRKEYLLVDGYNIIFAWEELRALADVNIDSARLALQDILSDYQGYRGCELILVFDAYKPKNHPEETLQWLNLKIVFTRTVQTADSFIERFSQAHAKSDRVIVATSDGVEQIIVRSAGSELMSAMDLKADILKRSTEGKEAHIETNLTPRNTPMAEKLKNIKL